jgi:hypothetical protein
MLPAYYALGSNPPGRAQIIPEFALLASVGAAAWFMAGVIPSAPAVRVVAATLVAVLLVAGPGLATRQTLSTELPAAEAYAATWDGLDRQVRADRDHGAQAVTVRSLPATGAVKNLDFIGSDRGDWLNQCVAGYYRVSSIAASPAG